ncbi:MAG: cytochrome b N-terminal domain-containing protein [Caldilineaceae bacterium]
MAVQPDVEKKGFLRSVATAADDVFTRITAGIDAGEFRRMLRGEPPGRPNPRLKPHSEAFLLHIKPTYYHESVTRFTHTFRFGPALHLSLLFRDHHGHVPDDLVRTVTGPCVFRHALPALECAHYGQFMRDLHRLGAEMMVAIVTLHMVRTYLTGATKRHASSWFTGVVLLVVTLFLSFSGYLLPWDQLAFWAVTIGTSMAKRCRRPSSVNRSISWPDGASDIGANGLLRFYLLHVLFLPLVLFLFFFVHYYKGRALRHQLAGP